MRQRTQLSRYVRVMQHSAQHKSFSAWRAFAVRRRELRLRTASWLTKQSQLSLAAVFSAWKQTTQWAARKRLAEAHCNCQRSRVTWRRWQRAVLLGKIERLMGASSQRVLERTLIAWRCLTQRNHAARRLRERQHGRANQALLQVVLREWQQWSRVQSRVKQLLACVAVGNHLRLRFLLWRQFTAQRQRLKRLVIGDLAASEASTHEETATRRPLPLERHRRVLQRFTFDWSLAFSWQRWRLAFHACLFHRMRVSYRVLTLWQAFARRQQQLRALATTFRQLSQRRSQFRVLHAWRDVVVAIKQIQRARRREREMWTIVQTEIVRRERRALQLHWRAWRGVVDERRHLEASLESYRRARELTKYWLLWAHDVVGRARQKRAKARELAEAMDTQRTRRCVRLLHRYTVSRKAERSVVQTFSERQQHRLLTTVVTKWASQAFLERSIRSMASSRAKRTKHNVFQHWRARIKTQKRQDKLLDKLVLQRRQRVCERVLAMWWSYVARRRLSQRDMEMAIAFHLHRCLHNRWRRSIEWRQQTARKLETTKRHLQALRQRRTVRTWSRVAHARRLQRCFRRFVLAKFLRRWQEETRMRLAMRLQLFFVGQRAKKALRVWHAWSQQRREHKQLRTLAHQHLQHSRIHRLWQRWLDAQYRRRQKRDAIAHYALHTNLKFLQRWHQATMMTRQAREAANEQAASFHEFVLKRRAVQAWRHGCRLERRRGAIWLACVVKIAALSRRRVMQVVLGSWHHVVRRQATVRALENRAWGRRLSGILDRWRQWVDAQRRVDQMMAFAATYREQRMISALFFHWQNYALAWKDAKSNKQLPMRSRSRERAHSVEHGVAVHPVVLNAMIESHSEAVDAMNPRDGLHVDTDDGEIRDDELLFRHPLSPIQRRHRSRLDSEKQRRETHIGFIGDNEKRGAVDKPPRQLEPPLVR
ncbi:hypothetical protein PINS_up016720 [Pythium insidiosum]|nr:hypothetical protein PINS_up016720 [Pythium insidiosum]